MKYTNCDCCYKCDHRHAGCHADCTEYVEWLELHDREKNIRYAHENAERAASEVKKEGIARVGNARNRTKRNKY